MTIRCLNIDWLEVYCLEPLTEPRDADFFRRHGWQVEERAYGTRAYRQMFTLLHHATSEPWIEIRRDPVGFLKNGQENHADINGCHLRLTNNACYSATAARDMAEFINRYGFTFQRIAKIDLCLDFWKFDTGDLPSHFLQRYAAGRYSKINQSRLAMHGNDAWSGRNFNSASWGSLKSPVHTRFYNKTLELKEANDKPHVRQAWFLAGLTNNPLATTHLEVDRETGKATNYDIWRLEFSLSSAVRNWVTIDNTNPTGPQKLSFRNTLECYYTPELSMHMFQSLIPHFFFFRHFEEGRSKYKSPEKVLFRFSPKDSYVQIEKVVSSTPPDTIQKKMLDRLRLFRQQHYITEQDTRNALDVLIAYLERIIVTAGCVGFSKDEIIFFRQLIARRMVASSEPMSVSRKFAADAVRLERLIWAEPDPGEHGS